MNWGIFILFIMLIIIIVVIVLLNRGNTLNILNSLPNYQIYYPPDNKYLGLTNALLSTAEGNRPISDPVYIPVVINSTDTNLGIWKLEFINTSFDDGKQRVKLINTIYNQLGVDNSATALISETGYVTVTSYTITVGNQVYRRLVPTVSSKDAYQFIYNSPSLNNFTLSSNIDTRAVCIDPKSGNPVWAIPSDNLKLALFQLVPLKI